MENKKGTICQYCGTLLLEGQKFCPKCGRPKEENSNEGLNRNVCGKCGAELQGGQEYCPKCGQKVGVQVDNNVNSAINQFNEEIRRKKQNNIPKKIIAIIIVVVVVILIGKITNQKDFYDMYSDIASENWCTIASDGSWMRIDTNPDDEDGDDILYFYDDFTAANKKIEQINIDLGFTSALIEKMNHTTWSQGKQFEENDKYKVSWTYHPDKGLEVLYELKK